MASLPFGKEQLTQLRAFINMCRTNPKIIKTAELSFFREYLEELGAEIPEVSPTSGHGDGEMPSPTKESKKAEPQPEQDEPKVESEESDVELDMTGVVEPDKDESLPMGELGKEASEEDIEKSNEKKREAISAYAEGEYQKAVDLYTEAIILNSGSALLYAKRGQALLALGKPNACVRDCTHALEANPDCAAALKFRGRAHRLLGHWEEAASDLRDACKIDFDEQADEWLREVTPNARKLEEHRRKYERKRAERELQERLRRAKQAREEHAKASAASQQQQQQQGGGGGGGSPGFDFYSLLNDPDIVEAFKDPELAAAFRDISTNPANMVKYQNNPKVVAAMEKLTAKFSGAGLGGMGGMPFPGAGFPPGAGPTPPPPPSSSGDDVGLD
ncbi:putative protein FAM10A4 [Schistocerca gregaria]|uniref:putative protein FAM10A4 n=1 Tax=Schistocerca gregaria TaxID=7010 RepID=UPI00211E3840|nr:putative protein FAM10A4 [Schistocerca gregaria]